MSEHRSEQQYSQQEPSEIAWEPMRIAVRGHLVPSRSQVTRRGQTRGKRREATQRRRQERAEHAGAEQREMGTATDNEDGADQDTRAAEKAAKWHILTPEEEGAASAIIGPRPWYTLALDGETVVIDTATWRGEVPVPAILRNGQPLRVGYYELRGISEWEVARRLRSRRLAPDDRHQLREAGFILPDPSERIALAGAGTGTGIGMGTSGQLAPVYAGYEAVLTADRAAVAAYCASHRHWGEVKELHVRGKQEFIKRVFYRYAYGYGAQLIGARVLGHQLFFDLTRLVTDTTTRDGQLVRGVRRGAGWARRGFSLKLCDCPYEQCFDHPRVHVVKLGRFKHRYAFERVSIPAKGRASDRSRRRARCYLGRFLDTIPFGLALRTCPSASLETMGETFQAHVRKRPHPNFAGPLTEDYLFYLVTDVQATYWLQVAELEDFRQHSVERTPESIYSTASLAKGYLAAFGFPRARTRDWQLALPVLGYSAEDLAGFAATTYFGGRAEVHWRSAPVEVAHLDFKSQYVSISHWLGLQRFWLAKDVTLRDCTATLTDWLTSRMPEELLAELRRPETWLGLCVLVQLVPDGRLTLPVRLDTRDLAQHRPSRSRAPAKLPAPPTGAGVLTIGQECVRSQDTLLWYTLPDVLAGILRDEAVPQIVRALAFVPSAEQVATHPVDVFGTVIDPTKDTVWTKFIDRRRAIKKAAAEARARGDLAEAARLDGQQHALKETALAGSYGVAEELNEKVYEGKALAIDVYALDRTRRPGNVVDEPGPYFAGALGTFIPAGGRLLLAICERLQRDRGLPYVFMDTDSTTPARPEGMAADAFERAEAEIVDWFLPLNPYQEGGSLLGCEDQNYSIDPSNPNSVDKTLREPLWCLATSAKRYTEYNRRLAADGSWHPVLRKFTAHGLGAWGRRDQDTYALPDYMDPPHTFREVENERGQIVRVPDSTPLGGPLWVYRLQWDYAYTLLNDRYPSGEPLYRDEDGVPWYTPQPEDWLDVPAFYQFSIETWADWQRVRHLPGLRPGGFLTIYPSPEDPRDPLTALVIGDEVVQPDAPDTSEMPVGSGRDGQDEEIAQRLDAVLSQSLLAPDSTALYSPYLTSGADAQQALARGELRRMCDDRPVPPDTELKTMYAVVLPYFTHGEAKAAHPYGVGELQRRHIDVSGVDVTDKESNRLAQAAAQETGDVLGGREQFGGRRLGPTGASTATRTPSSMHSDRACERRARLVSLFDEAMPDLLAASCLSRRTLERVQHSARDPLPETWEALERAMHLLAPNHPESIAGWREVFTAEGLAGVLGVPLQEAEARLRGRATWTESERGRLVESMRARRAGLTGLPTRLATHRTRRVMGCA